MDLLTKHSTNCNDEPLLFTNGALESQFTSIYLPYLPPIVGGVSIFEPQKNPVQYMTQVIIKSIAYVCLDPRIESQEFLSDPCLRPISSPWATFRDQRRGGQKALRVAIVLRRATHHAAEEIHLTKLDEGGILVSHHSLYEKCENGDDRPISLAYHNGMF